LKEATEAALGGEFIEEYLLVQVTRQGTGQAWHQDSSDPKKFALNRLIYTRDIAPESGQIVVVPGSIHRGKIPAGGHQDPISGELAVAPTAGTLVLMSTYCWHRVTLNQLPVPRFSVNYRARPKDAPEGLTAVANFRNGVYDFRTATSY
jgi:ectoine hydroxylase-related dioxygenase (phytanoyl-CoA dioxygenase family)